MKKESRGDLPGALRLPGLPKPAGPRKRSAAGHHVKTLNLDLRTQLDHAVRRDLKLIRRTQRVTLKHQEKFPAQA